ncbi:MAG TPA: Gfo/Idh/MocA family oxidoreductase [Capsulimonadaceae bacterium]|jgi:predicted dehydrogenase
MSHFPIGIGLIGTGGIAQNHQLPALSKLQAEGKVRIVAVAELNEEKSAAVASKYSIPNVYTNYADLLSRPDIDAVSVCTPNFLHKQPTIDALRAGKHVLVEKPIGLNAIEGAEMVETARQCDRQLMVGLNLRFGTGPKALKRFIDDGRIGDIYHARCHTLRRRGIPSWGVFTQKDKQGGGPLIDLGVHILDLTLWLMGYPEPMSVTGQTFTKFGTREGVLGLAGQWDTKNFTVEDYGVAMLRFKNGSSLVIESAFAANIERDEYYTQLMGTEGGAYINPRDVEQLKIFREESGTLTDTTPFGLKANLSHEDEIRAFVDAIANNTPVPVPGEQGLMVATIMDAIYKSSDTGVEVRF